MILNTKWIQFERETKLKLNTRWNTKAHVQSAQAWAEHIMAKSTEPEASVADGSAAATITPPADDAALHTPNFSRRERCCAPSDLTATRGC